jgi:cytochrome c553
MSELLKKLPAVILLCIMLALQAGCGEGEETNAPAVLLTASTVASTTANSHTHTVAIPFGDLVGANTTNYRSSVSSGHSHVIALSTGQLADLYKGYQVQVTCTLADGHTHDWVVLGGTLVYESLCYNCHGNDKRGTSGMSDRPPLASQRGALQNPSGQPFSTATAATPDPNFYPSTVATDGASLYAGSCYCHGPLASSTKRGRTASQITAAIGSVPSMQGIPLNTTQIQAITDALK